LKLVNITSWQDHLSGGQHPQYATSNFRMDMSQIEPIKWGNTPRATWCKWVVDACKMWVEDR